MNVELFKKLVRLMGEVAVGGRPRRDRRRELLNGVTDLISADAWTWIVESDGSISQHETGLRTSLGASSEWLVSAGPCPVENALSKTLSTADYRFAEPLHFRSLKFEKTFPEGLKSVICIFRSAVNRNFSEEERQFASIVFGEVVWLHALGDEQKTLPDARLSPRQRVVFSLLMQGLSRKEIADQMDISINTVAGYVREIYASFRVKSQVQLLRHLER